MKHFIFFGILGFLIETIFTGIKSLINKDWSLRTQTYLWMFIVYGFSGSFIFYFSQNFKIDIFYKIFICCFFVYFFEFFFGFSILMLTKIATKIFGGINGNEIIWKYEKTFWSPFGVINLKYFIFWFFLIAFFEFFCFEYVNKI